MPRADLVPRYITDKNGVRRKVWVNPKKGVSSGKQKVNYTQVSLSKNLKRGLPEEIAKKVARAEKGKGHEVVFKKNEVSEVLDKAMVGFISADLQNLDEKEKEKRRSQLEKDLQDAGYKFTRVKGKYGEEEESYMIMANDIDKPDLEVLGRKYGQESVIWSDGDENQMVYTTGNDAGKYHPGSGWEELGADAGDFYTEIKTDKGSMKFALEFDFDKKEEIEKED